MVKSAVPPFGQRSFAEMASLSKLPPKVLLRIFALLDLNDLVSIARVNKNFKMVAEDASLYHDLYLHRRHRLDDVISVLRRQRQAIRSCKMEEIADSNTILQHISKCPNLRKLKLVECDGERGIKEAIFQALFSSTPIREFSLKHCELESFPRLALNQATSLMVIDNTSYQYPLEYVQELLLAIDRNCQTIESLKLCIDNVSADDQNQLFDRIERCERLHTLQFQYPHVDAISERNFRKLFRLQNLHSLSVVVGGDTDEKAYQEFVARPCVDKLRKLELGGEISRLLPTILQKCPQLEILRLTCLAKPFLSIGNEQLLQMLSASKRLRDISLKSISVSNLRQAILQLPARLPQLQHIEIEVDSLTGDKSQEQSKERSSETPLKIEFNLLPNFALETQNLETSTVYVLFRSEELLKFITSGTVF